MSLNDSSTSPVRTLLRRGALLGLAALVTNLVVLGLGRALGASFTLPSLGDTTTEVSVTAVLLATVASLAVGIGAAAFFLARQAPRGIRILQVIGGVIAVVSVASPAVADTDTATKVALSVMHLVVGSAYIAALQPFARSTRQQVRHDSGP